MRIKEKMSSKLHQTDDLDLSWYKPFQMPRVLRVGELKERSPLELPRVIPFSSAAPLDRQPEDVILGEIVEASESDWPSVSSNSKRAYHGTQESLYEYQFYYGDLVEGRKKHFTRSERDTKSVRGKPTTIHVPIDNHEVGAWTKGIRTRK